MAAGVFSIHRSRSEGSRLAVCLTFLLAITLVFSPMAFASQTPEAPPEEPQPVEIPIPTDPDPQVPDPEIPPVDDPEPGDPGDPPAEEPEVGDPVDPTEDESDPDNAVDPPPSESDPTDPVVPDDTVPTDPDQGDGDDSDAGIGSEEGGETGESDPETGESDPETGDAPSDDEAEPGSTEEADDASDQIGDVDDPAATPTEEPDPTETPVPVVTWNQPEPVRCQLLEGSSAELAFNDSSAYRCLAVVNVSSDAEMPTDMQIQWQVELDFPDAYSLNLPAGSQAVVVSQTTGATATSTQTVLTHPWQSGSATQTVEFDVVLTRTLCVVGDQVLTVQAAPSISTAGSNAKIFQSSETPAAVLHSARFLPNVASLEVSMLPLDFGSFEYDGVSWGTMQTASTLTVSNESACGTTVAHVVSLEMVSGSPGMHPVLSTISYGGEDVMVLEGGDMRDSHAQMVLVPAGFEGTVQIDLEFTLTPGIDAVPGIHDMTLRLVVSATP